MGIAFREIVSDVWIRLHHSSIAVGSNIYTLIEFMLLLWLFARWNNSSHKPKFFLTVVCFGICVWVLDNVVLYSLQTENSVFRIVYSLILVYLSIEELNRLLYSREKNIIFNSKFIICIAFLVYYSYKATFEIFFMVQVGWSNDFYKRLFTIFIFVNLFSNILYALAVICIPKKQKFILPY